MHYVLNTGESSQLKVCSVEILFLRPWDINFETTLFDTAQL